METSRPPSLISPVVSVDVKHYVYLLETSRQAHELTPGRTRHFKYILHHFNTRVTKSAAGDAGGRGRVGGGGCAGGGGGGGRQP